MDLLSRLNQILDRDPEALRMLQETHKVIKDCGMTPEQADKAYEVCLLSASLRNQEAFKVIADEVWKRA